MRYSNLAAIGVVATALLIGCAADPPDQQAERAAATAADKPAVPEEPDEPDQAERKRDLRKRFKGLVHQWGVYRETIAGSSDPNKINETPVVEELIQLGRPAVPLIFEQWQMELRTAPAKQAAGETPVVLSWPKILEGITGERMIPPPQGFEGYDTVKDINLWFQWWEKHKREFDSK